jgi:hypothetical protein
MDDLQSPRIANHSFLVDAWLWLLQEVVIWYPS